MEEDMMSAMARVAVLCLAGVVLLAGSGLAGQTKTPASVKASIDNQCTPQPGSLVVPAGKTAKNFKLSTLEAGSSCATGSTIRERGFKIGEVFQYTDQDGKVTQKPGSLRALQLTPGTYRVTVGGGRGAVVVLTYELHP
jgi:hypothetical protein